MNLYPYPLDLSIRTYKNLSKNRQKSNQKWGTPSTPGGQKWGTPSAPWTTDEVIGFKTLLGASWGASWGRLGASWLRLGASWGRLGGVLARLGASWVRLGASWWRLGGVLGASWTPLGASWAHLSASWAHLAAHPVLNSIWPSILCRFSSQLRPPQPQNSLIFHWFYSVFCKIDICNLTSN